MSNRSDRMAQAIWEGHVYQTLSKLPDPLDANRRIKWSALELTLTEAARSQGGKKMNKKLLAICMVLSLASLTALAKGNNMNAVNNWDANYNVSLNALTVNEGNLNVNDGNALNVNDRNALNVNDRNALNVNDRNALNVNDRNALNVNDRNANAWNDMDANVSDNAIANINLNEAGISN